MLTKIAAFELRYQLRSPLFVVGFVLFFLLAFASVTSDSVQIGGAGNVNINSPYALLQTLGIINVFALFVVTAFVANVVIRDDDTRFAPIMNFFSIQSARYAQKRDVWMSSNGKPVDLAVYYHPAHEHNVQRMLDAMKTSLDLFNDKFSPYQFKQARVLEFPAYERFAQAFAGTMPYSEGIGFVQNFDETKADEKIDLVTYVTAHEVSHQWWAHQVIGANKQGMTLMSESFAQYSALLVMEKLYGREQIRKFLKTELDRYLRARGGEVVEELPLMRVENQGYIHYNKGAVVMYWLKEVVGEAVVNRALQKFLAEFAFKPAPYPSTTDFIRLLRAEAGPQHDQLITDLFEMITL
ncbi:MAG: M1 family aminopeptidase [Betaproteobacteria bacterium]